MTRVLASGYGFPEAPCVISGGRLAFSDVTEGGVFALATDGSAGELVPGRRGVGGLVAHADGGVVMTGRDLRLVEPDGSQRLLLAPDGRSDLLCREDLGALTPEPSVAGRSRGHSGQRFSLNDIGATPDGDVLAGALAWNPMRGEEPAASFVWRVGGDGVEAEWTGIVWPNGISMLPDGERFVVCDYQDGRVLSGSLSSPGELSVLASVPSGSADGLAVDAEGGVWVALGPAGGLARLAPDGSWDDPLDVPASFVTSAAFTDGARLAVTAAGAPDGGGVVFEIEVSVPGMELPPARI